MLVLTRKQQEKIRIGDNIVITVLKTKGKAVRIGIEAPSEMPVLRGELVFREDHNCEEAAPETPVAEAMLVAAKQSGADHPGKQVDWDGGQRDWLAAAGPSSADCISSNDMTQVSLRRVPREQATASLSLATGRAPLRSMLERRSQVR